MRRFVAALLLTGPALAQEQPLSPAPDAPQAEIAPQSGAPSGLEETSLPAHEPQAATPAAQDAPVIREIVFTGNATTQPHVMLREMTVKVGDVADPAQVERSREAVLDLGLFKAVSVEQSAVDGGVRLTFRVEEKWYILPIPRYSVSSDGRDQYGLSLRWYNVAGLNHTLAGSWSNSDDKKANKGRREQTDLNYSMPFLFDSPYNVSLRGGHSSTPILPDAGGDYEEIFDYGSIAVSRTFPVEAASQGWTVGTSVSWSHQDTRGAAAPAPYGAATALGVSLGFRDVRFRVYSEEGTSYGVSVARATEGVASDYEFTRVNGHFARYIALGATPHQSLHLLAAAGSYHGGPKGVKSEEGVYDLGGSGALRAYRVNAFVGDAYYHLTAEYLRPVGWDWLRFVAVAEIGNTFPDAHAAHLDRVYGSVGVGLRLRLVTFVNVEVEMGTAWPIEGGGGRFFASRL